MSSIVHRLSQAMQASQTLPALTRQLLQITVDVTQLDSAYLTTVDAERGVHKVLHALNTGDMQIPEGLQLPWSEALGRPAQQEGHTSSASSISAPVRFSDGKLYGTLCAASKQVRGLPGDAQDALQLCAQIIAAFAEREMLSASLRCAREELASLAMLDALTGLPNRRCVTEELNRVINHCRRTREWVLVGFVDLDHFKHVNAQYGQEAGDTLMRAMAEQLSGALRGSDMLARFGGDEFVMVGTGPLLDGDGDAVVKDLQQRLTKASVISIELADGQKIDYPGASVGMVCLAPDETDLDDALQKADAAMHRIKSARQKDLGLV